MRGPSLEEWRDRARAVLDPAVWSYLEAGADSGLTLAGAAAAWDRAALRPRVLRGVEDADTAASIFGVELALPVLTAPNGRATRYHPDGEAAVMRAAAGAGSIAILPSSVAASAAALAALHRARDGGSSSISCAIGCAWRSGWRSCAMRGAGPSC
ncbi:MAG: alpha-hydroxy-acid oxidizing protein [Sphingomonas sp.]